MRSTPWAAGLQTSGHRSLSPGLEKWDCGREDGALHGAGGCSCWERAAPAIRALPSRLPSHVCLRCRLEPCKGWASVLGPACPTCARNPSGCKAAPAMGLALPMPRGIHCFLLSCPPFLHVAPVHVPVLPHHRAIGGQVLPVAGSHLAWGHGELG